MACSNWGALMHSKSMHYMWIAAHRQHGSQMCLDIGQLRRGREDLARHPVIHIYAVMQVYVEAEGYNGRA